MPRRVVYFMSSVKEQFEEAKRQLRAVLEELERIKTDPAVIRYNELDDEHASLSYTLRELFPAVKYEEYDSCDHILVYSIRDFHRWKGGKKQVYCACIRCGLDQSVTNSNMGHLTDEQDAMKSYFNERGIYLNGTFLGIECDIDLARKIFSRIIETHPNIDDETAIKYFVKALNDIRDKEVSDERQESRAKRLSLNPDFRRWKH